MRMDFGQNLRPISVKFAAVFSAEFAAEFAVINFSYKFLKLTLWFLSLGKGWFWAAASSMDFNKFSEWHLEVFTECFNSI